MTPMGVVFTPLSWARWAVDRLDAPARVATGASFCDPTAGEGVFAWALAETWAEPGGKFDAAWARKITLIDRNGGYLEAFARRWRQRWGFAFPEDQQRYRSWFPALGLVGQPSELLLGRSRLDLAALVTARAFETLLAPGGRSGFFLPLSLFHNDGAPGRWRRWRPDVVFDLTEARPFPGVSTRCGWAEFAPHRRHPWPLPYFTGVPGAWVEHAAITDAEGGPWRLLAPGTSRTLPRLPLEPWQRPRQGINTGGCNAAFHVAAPPPGVDGQFVHPLAGKPGYILVPYDHLGKLLDETQLVQSGLAGWWEPWREKLAARKGVLLGSQLSRGRWWALLGVGPYAFAPFKVIWSAYGKGKLNATVFGPRPDGRVWQADQALQAYVPCLSEDDAVRVAEFLNGDDVAAYLEGLQGAGTKSWAQPGRFKPLWRFPPTTETPGETTGN